MYREVYRAQRPNSKTKRHPWGYGLFVCLVLLGYNAWALLRPLPALQPDKPPAMLHLTSTAPSKLVWPLNRQAAVGIVGSNILESRQSGPPLPTASTAKIITALVVLKQKPLEQNQTGPLITMSDKDVALYNSYVSEEGSVLPVQAGEQLSEYQMLQAMMLPSANNIADSLAVWAFGSLPAYSAAANQYVKQLGMMNTHMGSDASGLKPDSTSTASDMVLAGKAAMQNPVLAQIAGQPVATNFPLVNTVKNVNFLLGNSGIIGIKTGNSDQVGGNFVSASRVSVNNHPVIIVTAEMGGANLFDAVQGSLPLIQSAQANFSKAILLPAGSVVARYQQPWDGGLAAVTAQNVTATTWNGATVPTRLSLQPISPKTTSNQVVGQLNPHDPLTGSSPSVPLKLVTAPTKPSLTWRLLHPWPKL